MLQIMLVILKYSRKNVFFLFKNVFITLTYFCTQSFATDCCSSRTTLQLSSIHSYFFGLNERSAWFIGVRFFQDALPEPVLNEINVIQVLSISILILSSIFKKIYFYTPLIKLKNSSV